MFLVSQERPDRESVLLLFGSPQFISPKSICLVVAGAL